MSPEGPTRGKFFGSLAGHTYFARARRGHAQWKGGGGNMYLDRFLCVSAGNVGGTNQIAASVISCENHV